jgi:hypothetical protein
MKTQQEQMEFATEMKKLVTEHGSLLEQMNKATTDAERLMILGKQKQNLKQQNTLREEFMQGA